MAVIFTNSLGGGQWGVLVSVFVLNPAVGLPGYHHDPPGILNVLAGHLGGGGIAKERSAPLRWWKALRRPARPPFSLADGSPALRHRAQPSSLGLFLL